MNREHGSGLPAEEQEGFAEQERLRERERIAKRVLRDGGFRFYTSVPGSISGVAGGGYFSFKSRLSEQGRRDRQVWSEMEARFLTKEQEKKNVLFHGALEEHDINEIVDIQHEKQSITETSVVPGRKGLLGIKRTPDQTIQKETGRFRHVLHSEITSGGKDEPAVRILYRTRHGALWRDYSGRPGQVLFAEIVVPESVAQEVITVLDRDPAAIRTIVEKVMKEVILKDDPAQWEKPQKPNFPDALRPPYERWDAQPGGGKIYIQDDGMVPGFHPEALRNVHTK